MLSKSVNSICLTAKIYDSQIAKVNDIIIVFNKIKHKSIVIF